jgi:hypothetical protein
VYLSNLSDRLLTKSFWQPQTMSLIKTLVCGDTAAIDGSPQFGDDGSGADIHNASLLSLIPCPMEMVGASFTSCFQHLLDLPTPQVCIAIFRKGVMVSSPLPYVFTNPSYKDHNGDEVVLGPGDLLYVVGMRTGEDAEQEHDPMADMGDSHPHTPQPREPTVSAGHVISRPGCLGKERTTEPLESGELEAALTDVGTEAT